MPVPTYSLWRRTQARSGVSDSESRFETDEGTPSLADLSRQRSQLISLSSSSFFAVRLPCEPGWARVMPRCFTCSNQVAQTALDVRAPSV